MSINGELKIAKRKRGSVIVLALTAVFVAERLKSFADSGWRIPESFSISGTDILIFLALLVHFFLIVPRLLFKVLDFRPALVLSAQGIRCRGVSTLPDETVPWGMFSGFAVRIHQQLAFLELRLEDESAFLARYPECRRGFARARAWSGVPVPIFANPLAIEPEKLEAYIETRLPRLPNA